MTLKARFTYASGLSFLVGADAQLCLSNGPAPRFPATSGRLFPAPGRLPVEPPSVVGPHLCTTPLFRPETPCRSLNPACSLLSLQPDVYLAPRCGTFGGSGGAAPCAWRSIPLRSVFSRRRIPWPIFSSGSTASSDRTCWLTYGASSLSITKLFCSSSPKSPGP